MSGGSRLLVMAAFTAMLVGCDHGTKHLAVEHLRGAPMAIVPGALDLLYTENRDVAFGLLRAIPADIRYWVMVSAGIAAVPALLLAVHRARGWVERCAWLCIAAGALGNVADRVARGYVVDFVHIHHWPVFNVADVCICAGAALLASVSLARPGPGPTPARG